MLANWIDGTQLRPRLGSGTYRLQAKHESKRDDGCYPDITVYHNMSLDTAPEGVVERKEPSKPFYIECKLGDAFREGGDPVTSFRNTGIYEFCNEYEQLQRYKYSDNPVEHTKISGYGETYRDSVPAGDSTVVLACPYMLSPEFSNPTDEVNKVCGKQFRHTQLKLGFGILLRPSPTRVRIDLSHDHQFYFYE
jgi:hypothetical protein